jgi:hypothetical protein
MCTVLPLKTLGEITSVMSIGRPKTDYTLLTALTAILTLELKSFQPQNFTSPMASMEVQTSDQEEERAIHAVAEREEEDSKLNDTTLVKGFESVFNTPEYRLEMKMIKEVQHKGIESKINKDRTKKRCPHF